MMKGSLRHYSTLNARSLQVRRHVVDQLLPSRMMSAGGGGFGNVHDQNLPSAFTDSTSHRYQPLFRPIPSPRTTAVIPSPMTLGQPFVGVDAGPSMLLQGGLKGKLTTLGWRVEMMDEVGDAPATTHMNDVNAEEVHGGEDGPKARNSRRVGAGTLNLASQVYKKAGEGTFPLVLGGDHSVSIGSLAGILRSRPNTGVIWVDAHADLNTPWMSSSGNMHGMPVGLLMEGLMPEGKTHKDIPGLEWLHEDWEGSEGWPAYGPNDTPPRLTPKDIIYVGLRDVDGPERHAIKDLGIKYFTMYDIDRFGIGKVMDKALNYLMQVDPGRPIHLSYDIDAVDPATAPATGTAVRGGLTYREAHFVAERMCNSGSLASADLVELNPTLSDKDGASETVDLGLQIVTSFMGKSII